MPIKGLTDRNEGAFPQIGVIRKGAPKTQNAPGKDLVYFRVEFDDKETSAAKDFEAKFGKTPTDIIIVLPFNEIDRCWESWRETYVAGAMIHRCDGELVKYAIDARTGERLVINGIGLDGQPVRCKGNADGCKPIGRLRVIIPELMRLAYVMVLTTSIHDCKNISDQLKGISLMNDGRLAGIPLVLKRRPHKISTPSGEAGKRARREKWLISIEADPEWVKAKLAKMYHDALPGNVFDIKQIAAPVQQEIVEDDDEDELDGYGSDPSPVINMDETEEIPYQPDHMPVVPQVPAVDEKLAAALRMKTATGKELASLSRAARTDLHGKLIALPPEKISAATIALDEAIVYINANVND